MNHGYSALMRLSPDKVSCDINKPKTIKDISVSTPTKILYLSICQSDKTVYQGTISYITTHNLYIGECPTEPVDGNIEWVYNQHIKIYGDINSKIGN